MPYQPQFRISSHLLSGLWFQSSSQICYGVNSMNVSPASSQKVVYREPSTPPSSLPSKPIESHRPHLHHWILHGQVHHLGFAVQGGKTYKLPRLEYLTWFNIGIHPLVPLHALIHVQGTYKNLIRNTEPPGHRGANCLSRSMRPGPDPRDVRRRPRRDRRTGPRWPRVEGESRVESSQLWRCSIFHILSLLNG